MPGEIKYDLTSLLSDFTFQIYIFTDDPPKIDENLSDFLADKN